MRLFLGLILALFVVQSLLPSIDGLKFFFYNPKIGRSHVLYVGKLADVLAKAGHEVVNYQVAHTDTYTDDGTKHSKVIKWEPQAGNQFNFSFLEDRAWQGLTFWQLLTGMNFAGVIQKNCHDQLNDKELISRLKAEKFDFAFTEFMDLCGFLMFEKVGIERYAIVSAPALSMMMMGTLGVANSASFVPDTQFGGGYPPLTFLQRFKNTISSHMVKFLFKGGFIDPYTVMGQKYLRPDFDIMEKVVKTQMIFVNVDEHLDFPRPITHKIHYIGGIGMKKPEPLTGKYAKIFEEGEQFIYMSFGTMAPSILMPNKTKEAFLEAFSRFPHITFLWKYERPEEKINANHSNVILEKWWPQHNLLVHPKILGFITHGGMNSVSEASQAGVPLITVPLFGDQHRNAKMAEFRGFGVELDALSLSADSIADAIRKITENKSYKQNAHELSSLIKAKPYNSEDVLIKYSEFGAKFDLHERLDLSGRSLNTFTFYNLDVYLAIFSLILIVFLILFAILRCVVRCVWRRVISNEKIKNE